MKFAISRHCSRSVAALLLLLLSAGLSAEPYPLEYWALRDVVSNVQVSPNGKRVALMKIPTRDGDPIIEVYDAANFEREPFRVNADPMEITDFDWLSDRAIVVSLRQKVRDKIEGFNLAVSFNDPRLTEFYDFEPIDRDAGAPALKEPTIGSGKAAAPSGLFRIGAEPVLRAYSYYRTLDANLDLGSFTARLVPVPPPSADGEGLTQEEFAQVREQLKGMAGEKVMSFTATCCP